MGILWVWYILDSCKYFCKAWDEQKQTKDRQIYNWMLLFQVTIRLYINIPTFLSDVLELSWCFLRHIIVMHVVSKLSEYLAEFFTCSVFCKHFGVLNCIYLFKKSLFTEGTRKIIYSIICTKNYSHIFLEDNSLSCKITIHMYFAAILHGFESNKMTVCWEK